MSSTLLVPQMALRVCIDAGGPMFDIQVNGKRYHFEMHPWCGPTLIHHRTCTPLKNQPMEFLEAASLWAQQGQKVEAGLCVWYHKRKPIFKHLGGRHYQVLGYHPAERGA